MTDITELAQCTRELRYTENVEWFLNELAAYEPGDISYGAFEVYGEDGQGIEGSCEIDIPELAADAAQLISELREQLAQRDAQIAALTTDANALQNAILDITFIDDDTFFACPPRARKIMGRLVTLKTPAIDAVVHELREGK